MAEEVTTTKSGGMRTWDNLKEFIPWVMVILQFIYNYGIKQSTSDRMQATQQEDHAAITELRSELSKYSTDLTKTTTIVEMIRERDQKH